MKPSKKAWKPKQGEIYWFISHDGHTIDAYAEHLTKNQLKFGNYFRTRRAAQKAARAVREVLKQADRG